jgi:disulfide bond formation protein DsbB
MLAATRPVVENPSPIIVLYTVLALLAQAAVVLGALAALAARRSPRFRERLEPLLEVVRPNALVLATVVALVTVSGSLYMSEVADFEPCRLCWIQRGFIYPMLPVLAVAAWRDAVRVRLFAVPWLLVGVCVSAWHVFVEWRPSAEVACDPENPCSIIWIREFGYVTIPTMAGTASLLIITLLVLARRPDLDDEDEEDDVPSSRPAVRA